VVQTHFAKRDPIPPVMRMSSLWGGYSKAVTVTERGRYGAL